MIRLLALLLPALAWAQSVPGAASAPVRVENRLFQKEGRWFVDVGPTFLARGDYYESPGLTLTLAHFFDEANGVELSGDVYASWTDGGASEIFDHSGLTPLSGKPIGKLMLGYRRSFGYGKVLLGEGSLWHFDVEAFARAGFLFTDLGAEPGGGLGLSVLARISPHLFGFAELGGLLSIEPRSSSTPVFALAPAFGMGAMW